jgi:hypothetical protein
MRRDRCQYEQGPGQIQVYRSCCKTSVRQSLKKKNTKQLVRCQVTGRGQYPELGPSSRKELYSGIVVSSHLQLTVMTGLIRDIATGSGASAGSADFRFFINAGSNEVKYVMVCVLI